MNSSSSSISPLALEIISLLENEYLRLTPLSLERLVCKRLPGASRKSVRMETKRLVSEGRLIYTHHFSSTHVEINYSRPFDITDRLILIPSKFFHNQKPGKKIIRMHDGISFGAGDHPTTRLVLGALDKVLDRGPAGEGIGVKRALDIGTGSGILAIAAVALGVENVIAVDNEHVACNEARKNVSLNEMDRQIIVTDTPVDELGDRNFDLIMANLRPPTLRRMLPVLNALSLERVVWIFSGFRKDERETLLKTLPEEMSNPIWQEDLKDWSAFAVRR